ncbi:three-Cys-motif partner protein TcmP [Frankia sp. Cj3]|uniref:three-Cys-motif partner protein TcmP n=1 Tax=Frankia sp. Cj3 TaxID=2880976 RepID=UPI002106E4D3|nr:three-Cys-motif partner protein TcmP [Frankia sp. Cj3]
MPTRGPVPWRREAHTAAKHRVYDHYLRKWFPILLGGANAYRSATYVEGFSGPGIYEDSEEGSPIIAIRAFLETPRLAARNGPVRFIFIDDDKRCTRLLSERIEATFPAYPRESMSIQILEGKCEASLESALDEAGAWGYPILAVLDSWGNVPVPYSTLVKLASNRASEVVVTLSTQHFLRFVGRLEGPGDEVFGGDLAWREVAAQPDGPTKRRHLLTCYRKALSKAGFAYLLDFELVTPAGESLYLIFGTNHDRGVEKMKEALWAADPEQGVGFRDPRDVGQFSLFGDEMRLYPLARMLEQKLRKDGPEKVYKLANYALHNTVFKKTHVLPAVEILCEEGTVEADDGRPPSLNSIVRVAQPTGSGPPTRT